MKKSKRVKRLVLALIVGMISSTFARPSFNTSKDLLIAQFDNMPDTDDIMAIAALGCMMEHADLAGVNCYAVVGAYGIQDRNYLTSGRDLFPLVFGAENTTWTDAHLHYSDSVTRIKDQAKAILDSGGRVWVQEAGQSDITADWIRALINAGVAESKIKSNVVVVQHSDWNERMTSDADLSYVQDKTDYYKIADGNDGRNGTPDYNILNTSYMNDALSSSNPNAVARSYWTKAREIIENEQSNNSVINRGGVDYSDCVENWWIFEIGSDADSVTKFWNRYVTNTPTQENVPPTVSMTAPQNGATITLGSTVTLTATANDSDGSVAYVNFKINRSYYAKDSTSAYSTTWTPTATGTYDLTARAFDNEGASKESAAFTVTVIEDNGGVPPEGQYIDNKSSSLTYSGFWRTQNSAADYEGSMKWSSRAGNYVEYTFSGSAVQVGVRTGKYGGICNIYINGELAAANIDTYSNPSVNQVVIYEAALTEGTHTIRVEATGRKNAFARAANIMFDFFYVGERSVIAETIENDNAALTYRGFWQTQNSATDSGGSMSWSRNAGDFVAYTFTGDRVVVGVRTGRYGGRCDIMIDGAVVANDINTYSNPAVSQVDIFDSGVLSYGQHTVGIVSQGSGNTMFDYLYIEK